MTTEQDRNKAFVLEANDVRFNKRDYVAATRHWSEAYIQHGAHIRPGRDGLFDLIQSLPETLRYENQVILADGDHVMLYGRFCATGIPVAMIAADVRIQDGKLAEHWHVWEEPGSSTWVELMRPAPVLVPATERRVPATKVTGLGAWRKIVRGLYGLAALAQDFERRTPQGRGQPLPGRVGPACRPGTSRFTCACSCCAGHGWDQQINCDPLTAVKG